MRVTLRLPEPMLARSGPLPLGDGYAYELKWDGFRAIVSSEDGFRAIVSTQGGLRVRSRRGWNMTPLLPELEEMPPGLVLDGELIALGDDGLPSFPRLCQRMLHGDSRIGAVFIAFDLLRQDGEDVMEQPYRDRRARLEAAGVEGRC